MQSTTNLLNTPAGVSAIRLSRTGSALPSTRLVSTTVTLNNSIPNYDASFMTMQWGQLLDHDLTLTPQFTISKKRVDWKCLTMFRIKDKMNRGWQVEDAVTEDDSVTSQRIRLLSVCRSQFQVTIPSTPTLIAWMWFVQTTDWISMALHQLPDNRYFKNTFPSKMIQEILKTIILEMIRLTIWLIGLTVPWYMETTTTRLNPYAIQAREEDS